MGFQAYLCPRVELLLIQAYLLSKVENGLFTEIGKTCCKTVRGISPWTPSSLVEDSLHFKSELLSVPRPSHAALGCHGQLPRSPEQMWLESQACRKARGDDSCCPGNSFISNLEVSFSAHKLFLLISSFITAVVFASSLSLSSCLKGRFVHATSGA